MVSHLKILMGLFRLKRANCKAVISTREVNVALKVVCMRQSSPIEDKELGSFRARARRWACRVSVLWCASGFALSAIAQGQSLIQDAQGWVYVNDQGEPILRPLIYDNGPDYFEEGLARFVSKGKMGFHDQALTIQIPARYDFAFPFVHGTAKVGMDCEFIPVGEHRSVHCKQWETISNPLSGPRTPLIK